MTYRYSFQPWFGPNYPTAILLLCIPKLMRPCQKIVLSEYDKIDAIRDCKEVIGYACELKVHERVFDKVKYHVSPSDENEFALYGEIGVAPTKAPEAEMLKFTFWYELNEGLQFRNVKLVDMRL